MHDIRDCLAGGGQRRSRRQATDYHRKSLRFPVDMQNEAEAWIGLYSWIIEWFPGANFIIASDW